MRCVEKMRECKLSKQRKSLSWFAIFTAFSGDKVLSTRGDKFYEGQFLATRKTLTVSGGTLKNAKLNLDKNVPKYNSCIHIPRHIPRNAKLHIFEVLLLLQIRKYLRGVVCGMGIAVSRKWFHGLCI